MEFAITVKEIIELVLAFTILIAVGDAVCNRIILKKGFGVRSIQFVGVISASSLAAILALENIIGGEAAIAIFASMIGYLLAQISNFDSKQ